VTNKQKAPGKMWVAVSAHLWNVFNSTSISAPSPQTVSCKC